MRTYRDRLGSELLERDLVFYPSEDPGEYTLLLLLAVLQRDNVAFAVPVRYVEGDPLRNPVFREQACHNFQTYAFDPKMRYSTYRAGDGAKIVGLTGLKGSGKTLVTKFLMEERGYHNAVLAGPLKYAVEPIIEAAGVPLPHDWDSEPFKLQEVTLPPLTHDSVYVSFARMAGVADGEGNPYPDAEKLAMPAFPMKNFRWALRQWTRYYTENLAGKTVTIRHVLQQFGTDMGRALSDSIWTQAILRDLEHPHVVVDGVRFVDEAKFLRDRNAVIYGIRRDRGSYQMDPHPSEREMREKWDQIVDVTIENNFHTIHDLHAALRERSF